MRLKSILESLSLVAPEIQPGLGVHNLLFIAAELLLLNSDTNGSLKLAVIEELEAHLHPQAQLRLISYLQKEYNDSGVQEKVKEIFVSLLGDEWLENIPDSFMLPAREPQAESEDSHIFYDESSISIVFDTVYGVKGETHDATLYLETETKKSSDIRRILPLLERKITQCKNELQEKSRRCVYVGFSRPKYLLCLAIGEKTYVGHEAAFSSWKIVDLRSGDTM